LYLGQWSPSYLKGKKVYSKKFLLRLEGEPICQKKPDLLINVNDKISILQYDSTKVSMNVY